MKIRKNTVYVDIKKDKILTPIGRVLHEDISTILEDANVAVGLLKMSLNNKFSWNKLMDIFPKRTYDIQKRAKEMEQSIKDKVTDC